MANYSCLAIGINRYQYLQPLSYAQADAQELQEFLTEEVDLPESSCLLLTDASSWIGQQSTYPTQENILYWLSEGIKGSVKENGVFWFFFSGYSVNWEGQDYLMPVNGNPEDISGTGIPMRVIFESLQGSGADNIVAFLDISRSPGIINNNPIGADTVQLAKEMGIAVLLSTQIGEFSYEAAALGNGMFTAAVLEALRYYRHDLTLEDLEQYLRDRLPELSEHHWRPAQMPLMVVPHESAKQQPSLPGVETSLYHWQPVSAHQRKPETLKQSFLNPSITPLEEKATTTTTAILVNNSSRNGVSEKVEAPPTRTGVLPSHLELPPNFTSDDPSAPPPSPTALVEKPKREAWEAPGWSQFLFWGGSAALALVVAVLVLLGGRDGDSEPDLGTTVTSIDPDSISPGEETPQRDETILEEAKIALRATSASGFNDAIQQVDDIEPSDPLYEEAQENIARWSQTIFDIAQGRANGGDFVGAIAAARLVPNEQTELYSRVLPQIEEWKVKAEQQRNNQALIESAQELIRPTQASTYNRAITILREVSPGEPSYREAQELINDWSQQIYLIANSRAARGAYDQAIQTARLVPEDTPTYGLAQNAIANWQNTP